MATRRVEGALARQIGPRLWQRPDSGFLVGVLSDEDLGCRGRKVFAKVDGLSNEEIRPESTIVAGRIPQQDLDKLAIAFCSGVQESIPDAQEHRKHDVIAEL